MTIDYDEFKAFITVAPLNTSNSMLMLNIAVLPKFGEFSTKELLKDLKDTQ